MKKNKIILNFILLSFVLAPFFSCATTKVNTSNSINIDVSEYQTSNLPLEVLCPSYLSWTPLQNKGEDVEGFYIMRHSIKALRASWTCIMVDLDTPGIEVVASLNPEDLGISPPLKHVKTFAKSNDAIVAINATPWKNNTYPNDAVGIVKIDGIEYFPPVKEYCALTFSENPLRAHIYDEQIREEMDNYNWAFGGFFQVLKQGEVLQFNKSRRSRVAVGTNEEGNKLYFFVVTSTFLPKDGSGFNFEECAIVLKKLGCSDAMQFDGGHSSCLVLNKKDFQKPLLNRKIPIAIGLKK